MTCWVPCTRYRFGPRHIRAESAMIRLYNGWTRAAPYESIRVADIGDINVNLFDLKDTCKKIREAYREIVATGCIPLTLGEKTFSICRNAWIRFESTFNMLLLHLSWIPRRGSYNCIPNSTSRCWEVGANTRGLPSKMQYKLAFSLKYCSFCCSDMVRWA